MDQNRTFAAARRWLRRGVAALCTGWLLLPGCGDGSDGGDGGPPPVTRATVQGTVEAPAGVTLASTINSLGEDPIRDGAFACEVVQGGRQLTFATTAAGHPALAGWLDAEHAILSPRTTAEVLVYWASGGFAATSAHQERALDLLAEMPELDPLAASLEAALEADPEGFATVREELADQLADLVTDLAASADGAGREFRETVSRGILVNPAESRSGVTLNTVAGINALTLTNRYRRLGHCFIDRKSTFDSEGRETPSPKAITNFEVPAVQGLGNTVGTFVDCLWGRFAYQEKSTEPYELEAVAGAAKTRYRVCLVGPGAGTGQLAELSAAELSQQQFTTQTFVVRDLFLPLVLNVFVPYSSLDDYLMFIGGGDVVGDFIGIVGTNVPGIWEKAYAGDVKGALFDAYHTIASSSTFRNALCQKLLDLVTNLTDLETAEKCFGNAQKLLGAMKVVDAFLAVFDAAAVGAGVAQSNLADVWTVDVTPPEVKLTPAASEIGFEDTVALTCTVPEASGAGVTLVYRWSCAAQFGHLADGLPGHSDNFDSSRNQVTYTAGETDEGTDTITVEAFQLSGPAQHERKSLGTATATVEVGEAGELVLGGATAGAGFSIDDNLDVYLNGTQVATTGGGLSGVKGPFALPGAKNGDSVRLVVRDTYGFCASLQPVYVWRGTRRVKLTDGFDLGCGRPGGDQGVVFDQSFTINL